MSKRWNGLENKLVNRLTQLLWKVLFCRYIYVFTQHKGDIIKNALMINSSHTLKAWRLHPVLLTTLLSFSIVNPTSLTNHLKNGGRLLTASYSSASTYVFQWIISEKIKLHKDFINFACWPVSQYSQQNTTCNIVH